MSLAILATLSTFLLAETEEGDVETEEGDVEFETEFKEGLSSLGHGSDSTMTVRIQISVLVTG